MASSSPQQATTQVLQQLKTNDINQVQEAVHVRIAKNYFHTC
jgi:hypothetical protein